MNEVTHTEQAWMQATVKKYVAEKIPLAVYKSIHTRMLRDARIEVCRAAASDVCDSLIAYLETYMVGIVVEKISIHEKYPADWWQAVRERWFPRWWLARHPVRYRHIDIEKKKYGPVCPHISVQESSRHLEWMAQQSPLEYQP
jgi:hypothetical protein